MHTSAIALACLLCACSAETRPAPSASISVVDDLDREVGLAASATRIISLVPAATEMVRALDATDRLVARVSEELESDIASLPTVGRVLAPSIEQIVSLRPDLVIAWADAEPLIQRLQGAGLTVYGARIDRLSHVGSNVRRIGILLGRRPTSDSLADDIEMGLASLGKMHAQTPRPSVFYVLETDPLWTAGPNTFVNDLIEVAGGTNAFADLPTAWSEVSVEALLERQPDILILPKPAAGKHLKKLPGWSELKAVRSGRVFVIDGNLFNRPGPGVLRNARQLSALIHKEST